MDYEEMLDKGRKALPESIMNKERFEIPKVLGHIQGNKTVISNFGIIADTLKRDVHHFLKYILKELATPGEYNGKTLILGRKIGSAIINEKIRAYADIFVICPECKKPDTQLIKEDNILFMKCQACGAKRHIKSKI